MSLHGCQSRKNTDHELESVVTVSLSICYRPNTKARNQSIENSIYELMSFSCSILFKSCVFQ